MLWHRLDRVLSMIAEFSDAPMEKGE